MSNQSKKKEEDEFFEEKRQELQNERDERGEERLRKRREWLRSLTQADRDAISKYGFEYWEKMTGRKRDDK